MVPVFPPPPRSGLSSWYELVHRGAPVRVELREGRFGLPDLRHTEYVFVARYHAVSGIQ